MEQQKTATEADCLSVTSSAATKKSYTPPHIEALDAQATRINASTGNDGNGPTTGS
ncbi:hypothetical protein IB234_10720 [Pseudomonas sp. PDM16]|uniref:hypothetical protein n=1 Tax=Pseudomonas sp. PDM16 TaxID=2769292 RepID=UPI0017864A58|nr:hypothetical protein [Pseudomonas sp. PDM16]MBD9415032.1 hypothetical protein [Pseudomonas sp. PDM16]